MEPAQPVSQKPVIFRFTVTDAAGKPAAGLNANVALVMPIMDMGKNEFAAKETAPGVYEGSGAFSMDDEWEIFLTLQHGKDKPAKHVINVRVAE
jgi:nitrogen fixation protein FixH